VAPELTIRSYFPDGLNWEQCDPGISAVRSTEVGHIVKYLTPQAVSGVVGDRPLSHCGVTMEWNKTSPQDIPIRGV